MINFLLWFIVQLDSEAIQLYIEQLWHMFLCPNVDDDNVDHHRHNFIDQVMAVLC